MTGSQGVRRSRHEGLREGGSATLGYTSYVSRDAVAKTNQGTGSDETGHVIVPRYRGSTEERTFPSRSTHVYTGSGVRYPGGTEGPNVRAVTPSAPDAHYVK